MGKNFETSFQATLKHEGGFVDHPKDPGGMTNLGVTRAAWEQYVGRHVLEPEMRALTVDQVRPFYRKMYWDKVRGDDLPDGIDFAVYDFAVNSGPARAARVLQLVLGVTPDGVIGPKTLQAAYKADPIQVVAGICQRRQEFLEALDTFQTFGKGWTSRVKGVQVNATQLAKLAVA